jgi:hypothetical protein
MIKKSVFAGICFFCILNFNAFSDEIFNAKVYASDDSTKTVLYNYKATKTVKDSIVTLSHSYATLSGDLFAIEKIVLNNNNLALYEMKFPLLNEASSIIPVDDKVEIFFERDKKQKSKLISMPDDLVYGPTFQDFITENLEKLKNGENIRFSLPAPEFQRTVYFKIKKIENSQYAKPGSIVVEMKTTNILLWFIAKPIQYCLDEGTGRIKEIHGPTLLKRQVNGKWEYFDSDIYITYD